MDWDMKISPDDMQDVEDFSEAVAKKLSIDEVNKIITAIFDLATDLVNLGELLNHGIMHFSMESLSKECISTSINWAILIRIYKTVKENKKELVKLSNIKLISEPFDNIEI